MKSFWKENTFVLIAYFVFLLTGLFFVISYSKADLHLAINQWHTAFFDVFFKWITWLGSGWMVLFLTLLFLLIKVRYAVVYLSGNLLITIFVQAGKHLLFPNVLRPVAYFKGVHALHLVQGVVMHSYNSFPSGHSATAFGVFVILIFLIKNRFLKFVWLFIALLTAFSRVYISQHFMVDILAGSLTGAIGMYLTIYYFNSRFPDCCNFSLVSRMSQKKKI